MFYHIAFYAYCIDWCRIGHYKCDHCRGSSWCRTRTRGSWWAHRASCCRKLTGSRAIFAQSDYTRPHRYCLLKYAEWFTRIAANEEYASIVRPSNNHFPQAKIQKIWSKKWSRTRWIFFVPLFQYLQQTNYVTGIIVWSRIFNFIFNKIWFPLNFTLIPGACEHVKHETRSYSCQDKLNHINNPTTVVAALCCVVIELSTVHWKISQCFHNI